MTAAPFIIRAEKARQRRRYRIAFRAYLCAAFHARDVDARNELLAEAFEMRRRLARRAAR